VLLQVDNSKDAERVMMSVELFVGKSRDVPFLAYYPLIRGGYMVYTPIVNSPLSLSTPAKLRLVIFLILNAVHKLVLSCHYL
jgi:hypothetical protein